MFEKLSVISKLLARLIRIKLMENKSTDISNKIGDIITDAKDAQKLIRRYYQKLNADQLKT